MSGLAAKRLMKELVEIRKGGTPAGIILLQADDMQTWKFSIQVLGEETIYKDEVFVLKMKFGPRYPIESPEVTFVADSTHQPPLHPHVYSNGHICASILAVCITMQSMLASNTKRERYGTHFRPKGNDRYVRSAPSNPKQTAWMYDDDTV